MPKKRIHRPSPLTTTQSKLLDKILSNDDMTFKMFNNPRTLQRTVIAMGKEVLNRYSALVDSNTSSIARTNLERGLLKNLTYISIPRNATAKQLATAHHQLVNQAIAMKSFLDDKGSTVTGAQSINRAQDARIFGSDSEGNPLYSMSDEMRRNFWQAYQLFKDMYGESTVHQIGSPPGGGSTHAYTFQPLLQRTLAAQFMRHGDSYQLTPMEAASLFNDFMIENGWFRGDIQAQNDAAAAYIDRMNAQDEAYVAHANKWLRNATPSDNVSGFSNTYTF